MAKGDQATVKKAKQSDQTEIANATDEQNPPRKKTKAKKGRRTASKGRQGRSKSRERVTSPLQPATRKSKPTATGKKEQKKAKTKKPQATKKSRPVAAYSSASEEENESKPRFRKPRPPLETKGQLQKQTKLQGKVPTLKLKPIDGFSSQEEFDHTPMSSARRVPIKVERPNQGQEGQGRRQGGLFPNLIFFGLVVLLVSVAMNATHSARRAQEELIDDRPSNPVFNKEGLFSIFEESIAALREAFPGQDRALWASLTNQGRKVFYKKATQPSCMLFMYTEETRAVTECLVAALGNAAGQL